jgi:hypothetical protein
MKNLIILFFAVLLSFTTNLSAETTPATDIGGNNCTWKSWFKYPKSNGSYEAGKSVYVRVDPQKYQDIEYMEMYVNGKFIRKESQYPYEWAKGSGSSDSYLRNLKLGTYKLKCKIKDKCGQFHEVYNTFYVKGGGSTGDQCNYKAWFKYPQNGKNYDTGSDVYVRLDIDNYSKISYVELYINGKLIRKESQYPYEWAKGSGSSDSYLRNLKAGTYKLKARVYDKCGKYKDYYCTFYVKGGGDTGGECSYKAWFKYPQNGKNYNVGSNVYVKLDAEGYNKISYVELYVNGKLVRKENQYPYEWAKGGGNSDSYLRNLKAGTYKLKARVYDKCGKYKDYYCTFYVKSGGNTGDPGNPVCKYKSWYKYPKNNGTYRYGSDVYVRVDTEKYQDVAEMHLYVNGKFVRKETTYPYEWAKGNGNTDGYLRNLKRGTYNLKTRVKTKCGKWYEYYCKFYVK